ncbi:MAG: sulfatase [Bryobacteraceae bacterium]
MRLAVVELCVAALCLAAGAFAQQKPNVVVFLTDDMGYADTGPFGAKDIRTPHIDRLAREGVRLTNSYSNGPVCTPTRAGLMTGRYQQRVGLEWALVPADKGKGLPESETTIARMLKGNGYATAIFGKWHLGGEPEFNPRVHGFDKFFGITGGNTDMYSHENRFGTHDLWEDTEKVGKTGYLTEMLADRAVEWIGEHSREPFFLYVPFNAVHWPFQAAGRPNDVRNPQTWYDGTRPKDYAPMLEAMDAAVGRVLAALDKHGLAQNTLVIFTNDNGGERLSDNRPLFHHKATLWEGGIRVPSIVRFPGRLPAGKVSNQVTMTMDFAASILAATGVEAPADRKLDGVNVLPVLSGKQAPVERTLFWRIDRGDRKQKAVRQGNWKYLRDGAIEMLFDLDRDVSERADISFRHPEKLAALRNAMREWEEELQRTPPTFVVK